MHRLTFDQAELDAGETLWQDNSVSLIADFGLTRGKKDLTTGEKIMHIVLAIGSGDLVVLQMSFGGHPRIAELCRQNLCDIKLLSCSVCFESSQFFDILSSNGRAEMLKVTFDTATNVFNPATIFKAD